MDASTWIALGAFLLSGVSALIAVRAHQQVKAREARDNERTDYRWEFGWFDVGWLQVRNRGKTQARDVIVRLRVDGGEETKSFGDLSGEGAAVEFPWVKDTFIRKADSYRRATQNGIFSSGLTFDVEITILWTTPAGSHLKWDTGPIKDDLTHGPETYTAGRD